jgi:hypothetical protein
MAGTLVEPYRRFLRESSAIAERFIVIQGVERNIQCPPRHRDGREMCAIRLHDAWARFCRELVLASAMGTLTMTGTRVNAANGIGSLDDALGKVMTGQGFEPRWADAAQCIRAINTLQLENAETVKAALSLPFSPAEDLRQVRNFLAHRNRRTALGLATVADKFRLPRASDADTVLTHLLPPGVTAFAGWVRRFHTLAELAVN